MKRAYLSRASAGNSEELAGLRQAPAVVRNKQQLVYGVAPALERIAGFFILMDKGEVSDTCTRTYRNVLRSGNFLP